MKNWLLGKDPDAGKDWRQEETGTTEDEVFGWHHRLDGHEFEQAPGVGDGQGGLACFSPWACKELDTTEQLNWTETRELLRRARPRVGAQRWGTGFSEHSWGALRPSLDTGTVQRKGRCLDDAWVSSETKGNFETQQRRGIRILWSYLSCSSASLLPHTNGWPPLLQSWDSALSTWHCNPPLEGWSPALSWEWLRAETDLTHLCNLNGWHTMSYPVTTTWPSTFNLHLAASRKMTTWTSKKQHLLASLYVYKVSLHNFFTQRYKYIYESRQIKKTVWYA